MADDDLALLPQDDGMRFELLAASLRADANDTGSFLEALANKLGGALNAARTHLVRGIALKSEPIGLDEWIEALAAELTLLADRSAQDRAALQRLLG